jgi:hypothetical protein
LPNWDYYLFEFLNENNLDDLLWISSTMIEPNGSNPCCLAPKDYGNSIQKFNRKKLLMDLEKLRNLKKNVQGTTWPPNFMLTNYFNKIHGFSEEFSPGKGSDPDLAKKMWDLGCRNFIGVGKSLVYHFGSKTVNRFSMNKPSLIFKQKHGITINEFTDNILKRGENWTRV